MNWITKTTDEHTRAIDALCLVECVWYGEGEKLYRDWDHGIYEFRDLCWRAAQWTHSAWERTRDRLGEDRWEFDAEWCPELVNWLLRNETILRDPYKLSCYTIQHFVDELIDAEEKAAREVRKSRLEAQILDRQNEIFLLENELQELNDV